MEKLYHLEVCQRILAGGRIVLKCATLGDHNMTVPLPAPSPEGKHQFSAFIQRISRAIGFFIVPTPGTAASSPGTGLLVQLRGRYYFVSALHCFFHDIGGNEQVIESWTAARFKFRDDDPLGQTESLNEAVQRVHPDIGATLPLLPEGLLIDAKRDLLAVRIDPAHAAVAHAEFIDLERECFTGELTTGLSLLVLGVPLSSQVNVPGFGPTLIPQTEHVRFDADIDTSGLAHNNSPEYFFMPYSLTLDGIKPHGFSGASIFVNKEPAPEGIWTPLPRVVGILLRYFPTKNLLLAVKIRCVIELLDTDRDDGSK